MNIEAIKHKIRELFTEAENLEIDLALHQIDWANINIRPPHDENIDRLINKDSELVEPFKNIATSLYLSTICLLDSLKLHAYLAQFYRKFGKDFNQETAVSEHAIDYYWSGEPYNIFLANLRQFLSPLGILDDDSRHLKSYGIKYLETILRNTATIIHKSGEAPKSESEVYKIVRNTLECIFPSAISPKSNFLKTAQEYKPDILIPELSVAIEYKYAESDTKLKTTIAQISDDVIGYTGDSDYKIFYAVFYVKDDFWGKEKFKSAWREKQFPKNWRAFYIVGK